MDAILWLSDYLSGSHASMLTERVHSPGAANIKFTLYDANVDQVRTVLTAFSDTKMPSKIVEYDGDMSEYRGKMYIAFGLSDAIWPNRASDNTRRHDIENVLSQHDWDNAISIGVDGITPEKALKDSLVSGAVYDTKEGVLYIVGTNYTRTCKGYPLLGQIKFSPMYVKYTIKNDGSDIECLKEIFSNFDRKIPLAYCVVK